MAKLPPRLIFLSLASVAVILLLVILVGNGEPRYHGQPLSFWTSKLTNGSQKEQAEAGEALRAMGKSAVPCLIETLVKQDSPLKLKILKFVPRFPILSRWVKPTSLASRGDAARALGEIGPSASNAIPALTANQTNLFGFAAMAALMKIKGEPIGPLLQELEDYAEENSDPARRPHWSRSGEWLKAAALLAEFGTNARQAVPALCRGIKSTTNEAAIFYSVHALGCIHSDAQIAVPALVDALNRGSKRFTSAIFTSAIIGALGKFEIDARSAIPVLRQHLQDSNPWVRFSVLESLHRILPPEEYKTLVPALIQIENDPTPGVRTAAQNLHNKINCQSSGKGGD